MAGLEFEIRYLALLAGACYVLAYLIIHQVVLRLLVLVGTAFYIAYYYLVADAPLWDAIYVSVLLGVANVIGLTALYLRHSELMIPTAYKDLYNMFHGLPPGDFRALMRLAQRRILDHETVISIEAQPLDALYFVISGQIEVEKGNDYFAMPAGVFVGEVAFLTQQNSWATTIVDAGGELLVWDVALLRKRAARSGRFKLALEAVLSRDLALKVAFAVSPSAPDWRAIERAQTTRFAPS